MSTRLQSSSNSSYDRGIQALQNALQQLKAIESEVEGTQGALRVSYSAETTDGGKFSASLSQWLTDLQTIMSYCSQMENQLNHTKGLDNNARGNADERVTQLGGGHGFGSGAEAGAYHAMM